MRSIKAIGAVLAFIGIVLIGFFGAFTNVTGLVVVPFSRELSILIDPSNNWLVSLLGIPKQTVAWWSHTLFGLILGLVGLLLLRYG